MFTNLYSLSFSTMFWMCSVSLPSESLSPAIAVTYTETGYVEKSPGVSMISNSCPSCSPSQNPLTTSDASDVQDSGSSLTVKRGSPSRVFPRWDLPAPVAPSRTIRGTSVKHGFDCCSYKFWLYLYLKMLNTSW